MQTHNSHHLTLSNHPSTYLHTHLLLLLLHFVTNIPHYISYLHLRAGGVRVWVGGMLQGPRLHLYTHHHMDPPTGGSIQAGFEFFISGSSQVTMDDDDDDDDDSNDGNRNMAVDRRHRQMLVVSY